MSNGTVLSKVFDIYQHASDQTEIDHPLCAECTEKILGELEEQVKGIISSFPIPMLTRHTFCQKNIDL